MVKYLQKDPDTFKLPLKLDFSTSMFKNGYISVHLSLIIYMLKSSTAVVHEWHELMYATEQHATKMVTIKTLNYDINN